MRRLCIDSPSLRSRDGFNYDGGLGKIREDVFLLCLREIRRVDNLRDRGKDRFETESDRRPLLIARREGLDYAEPTYRLPL